MQILYIVTCLDGMDDDCGNSFILNKLHMHSETRDIKLQCQTAHPCGRGGAGGESWELN